MKHIRARLQEAYPSLKDPDVPIILRHDRVYSHATAHINFTTYDLQRDQDIIHPSHGKSDILVHRSAFLDGQESVEQDYPWTYARVLGIYHANIVVSASVTTRVEFLHVRWLQRDVNYAHGASVRRQERVHFVPHRTDSDEIEGAFGVVDPAHVIRACHLIPAFHHGLTTEYLSVSSARDDTGDWKYFYVNRSGVRACSSVRSLKVI